MVTACFQLVSKDQTLHNIAANSYEPHSHMKGHAAKVNDYSTLAVKWQYVIR